jgi:DNA-directed RNA polymerase specialized sigma24 family protein
MSSSGSVTYWIRELQAGNHLAAQKLWEGYFHRLVKLARTKLKNRPRGVADEEDVALSAFDSFFRGAEQGRFPQLSDRDDLWQLLVMITGRKVADLVQQECRKKRGGGKLRGDSVFGNPQDSSDHEAGFAQVIGSEPTPEFAAQVADECRHLFALLDDAELRAIALWKMEGYTNAEIAEKLGYVTITIERRLRLIRSLWQKERRNDEADSPRKRSNNRSFPPGADR